MRVILLLLLVLLGHAPELLAQSGGSKEIYHILETVVHKENATTIYERVYNQGLIAATDSLREYFGNLAGDINTKDSVLRWNDEMRSRYFNQLKKNINTHWNPHQIYFAKVVDRDIVKEIVEGAKSAEDLMRKDKTFQIHRISLPVFVTQDYAFVYVEFAMLGVLDQAITFRRGHNGIYFLERKGSKWRIKTYVGKELN